MSLTFRITYQTTPSEKLAVVGSIPELGSWNTEQGYYLDYKGDAIWEGTVDLDVNGEWTFKFFVKNEFGGIKWEAGEDRLWRGASGERALVFATWRDEKLPEFAYLSKSLFEDVIYHHEEQNIEFDFDIEDDQVNVIFEVLAGIVAPSHSLYVTGSCDSLGNWDINRSIPLDYSNKQFVGQAIIPRSEFPLHFKYVILDENNNPALWEQSDDRYADEPAEDVTTLVIDNIMSHADIFRGAGIAVPVFSLRSNTGLGVGEFKDLKQLADLSHEMGFSLIQLLPIYDTNTTGTWVDSYPYSAISVYALHPQYLHLPELTDNKEILADIQGVSDELNDLPQIDYERVMSEKSRFINILFNENWDTLKETAEYKEFFKNNSHWLTPYAVFCILRDRFNEVDFTQWPDQYKHLTTEEINAEAKQNEDEVSKIYYTQFYLDKQLFDASNYCASKGIGLKGDLPIGVNLKSADAWLYPNLFNLSMSTGAPPDQFSADGQNWGFPTYNWEEMAKDGYRWWRERLSQMGRYFHAFRIDHILGFFRIWEIPRDFTSGLMGHFYPSIPVHRNELTEAGFWDIDRLTDPYITYDMLQFHFGENTDYVVNKYLEDRGSRYVFKEFVRREQDASNYFWNNPEEPGRPGADHLERVFAELRMNVCLLQDTHEPYWHFFPRINMAKTTSFQRLDDNGKNQLQRIYVDYFYRRQEDMWYDIGMTRLPVIKGASKMLVCGEDLGMVPDCVYPVMNELSILGLRVQRMPPNPKIEFGSPHDYGYLTVCTPSSHDTSTIREWWEEDRESTQRFWNTLLMNQGPAPQFANESIVGSIIEQHLGSPSMWAIFPIQEFFGVFPDLRVTIPAFERINIPAIPKHYWRYRKPP
eukprot:TRINITY_DN2819_c0_g3_i1.p1 TRINITY_DN2819_c0_g3~~TRINITY_DN2819_c0_g3_i1.p1  ORF type:complete len:868 (+),score=235.10 TRINITY_DN2819_c0_g3_i1:1068-3671(+)